MKENEEVEEKESGRTEEKPNKGTQEKESDKQCTYPHSTLIYDACQTINRV